jgi:hypothetical protein
MDDERYHLTLSVGAQPVMQGWWSDRATAERKFRRWIGEHGTVTGARVTLVDEQEQLVLASWPDEADGLRD